MEERSTNNTIHENPWIVPLAVNPLSTINFFYFHFAGGTASSFREISKKIIPEASVYGIQLPGREGRNQEKLIKSLEEIVNQLAHVMKEWINYPTIFFGHSMGALLAYELAITLKKSYGFELEYLIASGKKPPHIKAYETTYQLSDKDFIHKLKEYQGTPQIVLEDEALMQHFLPRLKADAQVIDTYCYQQQELLNCPIFAMCGRDDPLVSQSELNAWQVLTSKGFSMKIYSGGHFYIVENQNEVADKINQLIGTVKDN